MGPIPQPVAMTTTDFPAAESNDGGPAGGGAGASPLMAIWPRQARRTQLAHRRTMAERLVVILTDPAQEHMRAAPRRARNTS